MALAMNSRDWMRKLARTFVRDQSVPGWRSLTLSLSAHGLALVVVVWVLALQGSAPVVISPARVQVAPIIPAGTVSLPPRSQTAPLQVAQKNARRAAVKHGRSQRSQPRRASRLSGSRPEWRPRRLS